MKRLLIASLVSVFSSWTFSAYGNEPGSGPSPLTAEEVARRATATSFDVRARNEEVAAAKAGVDQAWAAYLPKVTTSIRYTRLSDIDRPVLGNVVTAPGTAPGAIPAGTTLVNAPITFPLLLNQTTLQSTLQLPLSDYLLRLPQAHEAANKSHAASLLKEQLTRLKVATDARVLYYNWIKSLRQTGVAEQALEQARAHLKDVKNALDAGTASKADVLRVESQVAANELLVVRSQNLAKLYDQQLRTAMHDSSGRPYAFAEDMEAPLTTVPGREDPAGLAMEALRRRIELRMLDENASSLRESAKVARAASFPRLDASGSTYYANPNQRLIPQQDRFTSSWDVTVQLSFSPSEIFSARAAGRSSDARAAAVMAEKDLLADAIKVEVVQTEQALSEAETALETSSRGLVAAEESYRVRRVLFQNGKATSVELTDAETELTRARLEAVNARVDLRIARTRLDHALGRDLAGRK